MRAIRTFGITVPRRQGEVGQTSKLGAESAVACAVSVDLSPWLPWSGRCSLRRHESRLAWSVVLWWDGISGTLRHPESPAGLPRSKDAKSEPNEVARMRFNQHICSATAGALGASAQIPTV